MRGRTAAALALAAALIPLGLPGTSPASVQCFGLPATITAVPGVPTLGTPGNDVIVGTPGPDLIRGGKGHDRICGLGGGDDLRGNAGRDRISGGDGDDTLNGGGGARNVLRGNAGADRIEALAQGDRAYGGAGPDDVASSAAFVVLRGNGGRDIIWSGYRNDIDGGAQRDHCGLDMDVAGVNCERITLLCGSAGDPLPGSVTSLTTAVGDFDGDGWADALQVYRSTGWEARIATASGFATTVSLPTGPAEAASAVGGHDVDGDGVDEAFVVVGSGAYTKVLGLYTLYQPFGSPVTGFSCGVRAVEFAGTSARAEFPVGASVMNYSGLACRPNHALREYSQSTVDGITFTRYHYDYSYGARFAAGGPVLSNLGSGVLTLTWPTDAAAIQRAGQFTCGSLSL